MDVGIGVQVAESGAGEEFVVSCPVDACGAFDDSPFEGWEGSVFDIFRVENDGPCSVSEEDASGSVLPIDESAKDFASDDKGA